ncbi:hypothetical protein PV327_001866 [Microctonus hyperodae]|uniref:GPI ethanolamine phosphate transferase 2 C-terminal domain-containing protein n=1 Tax=Microctonus hyperodae TaxID=165561 RepID=A0AA39KNH8_MICHY|nr:hypothetical protein PV327_001866 [Microctonus hyperodae]
MGDRGNMSCGDFMSCETLILLVTIGLIVSNPKYSIINLIFYLIISSCIYLHHASNNAVIKPLFYPESSGINEVKLFWIAVMGFIIHSFVHSNIISYSTSNQNSILRIIIQLWIMISAMLHRPHNIILLPMQLITCKIISDSLQFNNNKVMKFYANYCIGNVFYFYQGNSNSLATVDVAAGYVGLQSFILPITTIFICINTFSAPILAYLMTLHDEITSRELNRTVGEKIFLLNRLFTLFKFLPLSVYTIIITIMRYHLFVWSVFSPKLLYEAMYSTVLFITMFTMQSILSFTRNERLE